MSEARLSVAPIDSRETFKDKAYAALRNVIVSLPKSEALMSGVIKSVSLNPLAPNDFTKPIPKRPLLAHIGSKLVGVHAKVRVSRMNICPSL